MSPRLQTLIERARRSPMTPQQREAQRRSFVYGNTKIENDMITRVMVDAEADRLPHGT